MRAIALAAALSLPLAFASGTAMADPATVHVTVGEKLQDTAKTKYGERDIARLTETLKADVERALARTGVHQDARVELTLVDVVPNRPTFKQLGDRPGLSMQSFGVGGAKIEGRIVAADGAVTPVSYRWYETDIRQAAWTAWTWSDAEWAFDKFARKLSQGDALASR